MVLAIPIKLPNRSVYMSYNFETNYYLPYFDIKQGIVPVPWATVSKNILWFYDKWFHFRIFYIVSCEYSQIDEPNVNSGSVVVYETNLPDRGRILTDGEAEFITGSTNSTNNTSQLPSSLENSAKNLTQTPATIKSDELQPQKDAIVGPKLNQTLASSKNVTKSSSTNAESDKSKAKKSKARREVLSTLLSRKKFYKILIHKLEMFVYHFVCLAMLFM